MKFSQTPFEVSNIPEHFHYSQHFQNFPTLLPVLNMDCRMMRHLGADKLVRIICLLQRNMRTMMTEHATLEGDHYRQYKAELQNVRGKYEGDIQKLLMRVENLEEENRELRGECLECSVCSVNIERDSREHDDAILNDDGETLTCQDCYQDTEDEDKEDAPKCENCPYDGYCSQKLMTDGSKSGEWGHTNNGGKHPFHWAICDKCFEDDNDEGMFDVEGMFDDTEDEDEDDTPDTPPNTPRTTTD